VRSRRQRLGAEEGKKRNGCANPDSSDSESDGAASLVLSGPMATAGTCGLWKPTRRRPAPWLGRRAVGLLPRVSFGWRLLAAGPASGHGAAVPRQPSHDTARA
jgi:hypothetical protein